jgi:hypothetical protein
LLYRRVPRGTTRLLDAIWPPTVARSGSGCSDYILGLAIAVLGSDSVRHHRPLPDGDGDESWGTSLHADGSSYTSEVSGEMSAVASVDSKMVSLYRPLLLPLHLQTGLQRIPKLTWKGRRPALVENWVTDIRNQRLSHAQESLRCRNRYQCQGQRNLCETLADGSAQPRRTASNPIHPERQISPYPGDWRQRYLPIDSRDCLLRLKMVSLMGSKRGLRRLLLAMAEKTGPVAHPDCYQDWKGAVAGKASPVRERRSFVGMEMIKKPSVTT